MVYEKTAVLDARVVAGDVNEAAFKDSVIEIKAVGGKPIAYPTEVTNRAQVHALVVAAVDIYGSLDVMINNAGTMPMAFYADHEIAADAWERCIGLGLKGDQVVCPALV